jgi:acyl dehydratase
MDPAAARALVGVELPVTRRRWSAADVILYHLGIGAGAQPSRYVYERGLVVLPGFAATVAHATGAALDALPAGGIDRARTLHAEQEIELHGPLPVEADTTTTGRVLEVADMGRWALVRTQTETRADGALLFVTRFGIAVRDAGGFGIRRLAPPVAPEPSGAPDLRLDVPIDARQALVYRLCGDRNPLHVDAEHARAAGFPAPILHGLSTYGTVLRALVDGALDGRPESVATFRARFRGPLYPGETLRVEAWWRDGLLLAHATVPTRGAAVLLPAVLETAPTAPSAATGSSDHGSR